MAAANGGASADPTGAPAEAMKERAPPHERSLDDWNQGADRVLTRFARWNAITAAMSRAWPFLSICIILGVAALAVLLPLPFEPFSRESYVDENALQPGLADVTFSIDNVGYADEVSARLLGLAKHSSPQERVAYLVHELEAVGLDVYTQAYAFDVPSEWTAPSGTNVYARLNAPRTDGREAMVIAASWESAHPTGTNDTLPFKPDGRRTVNVRGVASLLALARHLPSVRSWSKDIIFVVSDGHLDGMSAWATRFFGARHPHLSAEPVNGGGARLWNAVALDYPGDSFSSLVVRHEGLNGQLPNLDTLNSVYRVVQNIAGRIGLGVGGATYEYMSEGAPGVDDVVSWGVPRALLERVEDQYVGWGGVRRYIASLSALWSQWRALLAGHPTGVHGVLLPYHVDAVTLFAVPADGPFGFVDMGRISESLARTFSNLIERLHHSQFFYLLLSINRFVQIGVYLFVPLALGALLTITGLRIWSRLASRRDERRAALLEALVWQGDENLRTATVRAVLGEPLCARPTIAELDRVVTRCVPEEAQSAAYSAFTALGRPVWAALACVCAAHLGGLAVFAIAAHTPLYCAAEGSACAYFVFACALSGLAVLATCITAVLVYQSEALVALAATLHAFALLHAGLVVSVTATVNVAQATTLAAIAAAALYPLRAAVVRAAPSAWRALYYISHALLLLVLMPPCVAVAADIAESHLGAPRRAAAAVESLVWDWHILRSAGLPFFTVVCTPVLAEGAMAAFMYSVGMQ